MLLLKYNIMAEIREAVSGGGSIKQALGSLLAAVGVSLAGAPETAAQTANQATEETKLTSAEETRVFASLSRRAQTEIRAAYVKCMDEVEEFSEDASGGDPAMKQVLYDDGAESCDDMRNSRIRSARANQDMDNITREITTG